MSNEELLEQAKEAASELFGDTSVPVSVTRENLNDLIGHIEDMIDTLPDD